MAGPATRSAAPPPCRCPLAVLAGDPSYAALASDAGGILDAADANAGPVGQRLPLVQLLVMPERVSAMVMAWSRIVMARSMPSFSITSGGMSWNRL